MTTAIEVRKNTALDGTFSNSEDVYSLAKRIKVMVPGGSRLTDNESRALAQVSLVTNCNPFIGEVWYIPGSGPMIGIRGLRRHGDEQITAAGEKDDFYNIEFVPCSPEEAGAPPEAVNSVVAAWKAILTDSVSSRKFQKMFMETVDSLRAGGSKDPVGDAREICGKRPVWNGYGYATKDEKTKMNKQYAARKRAEAEALKQRFDIPFGVGIAAADTAAEADNSAPEWMDGETIEQPQQSQPSESESQAEIDLKSATRPYSPEQLKERIQLFANDFQRKEKVSANKAQRGLTAGMVEICFARQDDSDAIRHAVTEYLTGYKSTSEIPGIYILALLEWLKPTKDSGGEYTPDKTAVQEAIKVHQYLQSEAGQLEMNV